MERERLSTSFFINHNRQKNGEAWLQCRVSFRTLSKSFSTGIQVPVDKWNADRQRLKGSSENSKTINESIEQLKSDVLQAKSELIKKQSFFSVHDIVNLCRGTDTDVRFLLKVYRTYIDKYKKPLVEKKYRSTTLLQKHERTYKGLEAFIKSNYQSADIDLRLIDFAFVSGFKVFLMAEEGLKNNTALKNVQRLREVFRYCLSNGWVGRDPFKQFKFNFEEVKRQFLTEEDLNVIEAFQPESESLQSTKDVFLFTCYTGLAYVDVKNLKMTNLIQEDGRLKIRIDRTKTKVESYVPLIPKAQAIISKYQFCAERIIENRVLPVRSNQKSNEYLKVLMDLSGIKKPASMHLGRHSFACLMLSKGISMESVSKMLGHKNLRTTQIYGKIQNRQVDDEMQKLM